MIEQTSGETTVTAEGRSLFGMAVPPSLAHIADAVEKSRRILDLPDNWDAEGSPGYSHETWERAARFVFKNALRLWADRALSIESPAIDHGPDGSVDVHWQDEGRILLINIPRQTEVPAEYYGRDSQGHEVKGTLDTTAPNPWLMMWLVE